MIRHRVLASAWTAALVVLLLAPVTAAAGAAAACDTVPPLNTLEMTQPLNLGELKQQVLHYACSGVYDSEVAKVLSEAQAYVERRAGEVAKPAHLAGGYAERAYKVPDPFYFIP